MRNAREFLGIPLAEAVRVSTRRPAEILRFTEKDRVSPGADADLTLLTPESVVGETTIARKAVCRGEGYRP